MYREAKDHNGLTGRGKKTCRYYTELDAILGNRPASVLAVLLDTRACSSGTNTTAESQEIPEGEHKGKK